MQEWFPTLFSTDATGQLLAAFTTVFFILGVGFGVQRLNPFSEEALSQFSRLVVNVLLPVFLFYVTATGTDLSSIVVAPVLIVLGIGMTVISLLLAVVITPLVGTTPAQRPAFRFSTMVANTAFLGIPICGILFGAKGVVYAVLYDFGTTLVVLTVGIWVLSGGRWGDLKSLLVNPLILGVVAGLLWAVTGWQFPEWVSRPCATLGDATLPIALLVAGMQLGSTHVSPNRRWQPIAGVTTVRLVLAPLAALLAVSLLPLDKVLSSVVVIQAAMPVGLTAAIMARSYGTDAGLVASATLYSTLTLVPVLPLLMIVLL